MEQSSVSQADSDVVKESKQILKRKIKAKADKTNRPKPAPGSSVFRPLPAIPSQVEQKHLLQTAFKLALTGGTFIDTKFYAFSRRRSSGLIDKPLPLFANSSILRAACPYFEGREYSYLCGSPIDTSDTCFLECWREDLKRVK